MADTSVFGVYFKTDESNVDEDEVKKHFSKYGRIVYVKHCGTRVYINYRVKADAENCLLDVPDPKFGVVKRGKFPDSPNSSNEINSQKSDRHSFPKKTDKYDKRTKTSLSPHQLSDSRDGGVNARNTETEFEDSYQSRENYRNSNYGKRSPRSGNNSVNGKWNNSKTHKFEENESIQHFSDSPPPLLSVDVGPPPLLSIEDDGPPPLLSVGDGILPLPADSGPPPLISAQELHHCTQSRPSLNAPHRLALLPTPPSSMRLDYKTEQTFSDFSKLPVQKQISSSPPPLISMNSNQSEKNSVSITSYDEYLQKYGKYVIIANIPQDTTTEEMEKVLFPHIPLCVSNPEETNRKRILFCFATFDTQKEATKAAKQLDGVELRKHCLNMIRLDELIMFSDEPF